jgi:hypothetical protein
MDESELLKRGEEIYAKLLSSILPHYKGQFIVIDSESAEYWIEKSLLPALKKAKEKYPKNIFFSVKIGAREDSVTEI